MHFWELTVLKDSYVTEGSSNEDLFGFHLEAQDGTLNIELTGRLDTLSSPDLLKAYQEAAQNEEITSLSLDFSKLDYISSAGLRVLLIMYKALKNKNNFSIDNASDSVKEIFITTGFDSAFNLEWS
ncbi:MAG: STAS domain-containing protein [Oribacterium sp.]|nr:STAS domain-containing protein [Oribacterium sp.]